eukprot:gene18901-25459_t
MFRKLRGRCTLHTSCSIKDAPANDALRALVPGTRRFWNFALELTTSDYECVPVACWFRGEVFGVIPSGVICVRDLRSRVILSEGACVQVILAFCDVSGCGLLALASLVPHSGASCTTHALQVDGLGKLRPIYSQEKGILSSPLTLMNFYAIGNSSPQVSLIAVKHASSLAASSTFSSNSLLLFI